MTEKTFRRLLPGSSIMLPLALLIPAILAETALTSFAAPVLRNPASEFTTLKPISDEDWNALAGARIAEKYEITKGDTLYGISSRLFGDPKYWPKIWAMNNAQITNPHLIRPGNAIAFMPGTGNSLPEVAIGKSETALPPENSQAAPVPRGQSRSQEWKLLDRQPWETVQQFLPPEVDPQGFDEHNIVQFAVRTGFELEAVSSTEELPMLGEITGSRSDGTYLTIGDTVYIKGEGLQIGDVCAITHEPETMRGDGRKGLSYLVAGKVRITAVKDSLFIGTIETNKYLISRGDQIMRLPARIQGLGPVSGNSETIGTLLLNKNFSTFETAQYKQVVVDRGSEDGIGPGMIFRAFQKQDPVSKKSIARSNSLIDGDIMIVQVSEGFSTGIVMRSLSPLSEGTPLVLLTDVSDLLKKRAYQTGSLEEPISEKPDELELLDRSNEDLGPDEKKELQQLESWKEKPEAAPEAPPEPSIEELPPPPETAPEAEEMPSLEESTAPPAAEPAPPPAPPAPEELPPEPKSEPPV